MSMEEIRELCRPHIQKMDQAAIQIKNNCKKLLINSQKCEKMANEAIIRNSKLIGKMTEEIWDNGSLSAH